MNGQDGDLLGLLGGFMSDVDARMAKQADHPTTGTHDDPGGRSGQSTHPVAHADSGTTPVVMGAHAADNAAEIKKNVGEPNIDSPSNDNPDGGSTKPSDSIGTQSQESDEVKGNVDTGKATKDGPSENGRGDASPGHPSNRTFSEKYSQDDQLSQLNNLGGEILQGLQKLASSAEEQQALAPTAPAAQDGSARRLPQGLGRQQRKLAFIRS